jgi:DNA-binding CsgD family transcriptional regulator
MSTEAQVRELREAWVKPEPAEYVPLNTTEKLCIAQLFLGKSNQLIAKALGISRRTVENSLSSAYKKLGCTGQRGLFLLLTMAQYENRTGKVIAGIQ